MFRIFLLGLLSFFISLAHATDADTTAKLKEVLSQVVGDIAQINKTPVSGLYEVVTIDHIFYADEKGKYLFDGSLIDIKARRNITEARARKLFAIDFGKLPLELAMKKVKGNGSRKMAYFTDPNCGWCKKLEHEMQSVDDVTLYLFMSTHIGGSDSAHKAQGIWCSKDRVKAWDNLMLNGVQPEPANCETPTDKVMELSRKLRVDGTPALIFANGVINPGYLPAAEIEKALNINK